MSGTFIRPVEFLSRVYTDEEGLTDALGMNWKQGMAWLLTEDGYALMRSAPYRPASALPAWKKAVNERPQDKEILYCRFLTLSAHASCLYWRGRNYGDYAAIKAEIVKDRDEDLMKLIRLLLREQIFASWVRANEQNQCICDGIAYLQSCMTSPERKLKPSLAISCLKSILLEPAAYRFEGKDYANLTDLAADLQNMADQLKYKMEPRIRVMFADSTHLAPEFAAWLILQGRLSDLKAWDRTHQRALPLEAQGEDVPESLPQGALTEEEEEDALQRTAAFSAAAFAFEQKFTAFLRDYRDALDDERRFYGLLLDLFPSHELHMHLIFTLYQLGIKKAVDECDEPGTFFFERFVKMLTGTYGIQEAYARWAVSLWLQCYGKDICGKNYELGIYKVLQGVME